MYVRTKHLVWSGMCARFQFVSVFVNAKRSLIEKFCSQEGMAGDGSAAKYQGVGGDTPTLGTHLCQNTPWLHRQVSKNDVVVCTSCHLFIHFVCRERFHELHLASPWTHTHTCLAVDYDEVYAFHQLEHIIKTCVQQPLSHLWSHDFLPFPRPTFCHTINLCT